MIKTRHHSNSSLSKSASVVLLLAMSISMAIASDQPNAVSRNSSASEIEQFCGAIADPARDQRYLLQKKELEDLQAKVDARIKTLETRQAEYKDWLDRRNQFLKIAEGTLVDIYKGMKPDAAAAKLESVDLFIAAAIVMKLPPKQSSLVLTEMSDDKVAKITAIISSAGTKDPSKDPT